MSTDVTSGVGRIVWGHPMKGRPKVDARTKQPVLKDGKPVTQWVFGVAFPKAEFTTIVWPVMSQEAMRLFPSGQFPPSFAWKYDDGDTIDSKGKPFADRTSYAGSIVIAISTEAFMPQVVKLVNGVYQNLAESEIKCGDYVRVALNIDAHGPKADAPGSPSGLYVNPRLIELVGTGDAIINGPDASTLFGGAAVALPPGATAIGAAPPAPGGALPLPAPGNAPAPSTAPFAAPVATPPAAAPAPLPGMPPTVSPTNPAPLPFQPHQTFVPAALAAPPPPAPAPVAPAVQTPLFSVPAGSPMPAGYRFVSVAADGQWLITTP